jgi:hypothetical protein
VYSPEHVKEIEWIMCRELIILIYHCGEVRVYAVYRFRFPYLVSCYTFLMLKIYILRKFIS